MFKTCEPFSRTLPTPRITYGFFSREGGVSQGIYESLNCGYGSSDKPENVTENRKRVVKALKVEKGNIFSLKQVHSAKAVVVSGPWAEAEAPEADAMVTDHANLALGALSADCAPVLFAGIKADGAPVIGAAHAGWRGALGGVIRATRDSMVACGALPDQISAVVGPCLGPQSYEVGPEFKDDFSAKNKSFSRFFRPLSGEESNKFMFDLPGFVLSRLQDCGIKSSFALGIDTYPVANHYFSYRRNSHEGIKDYGRQISAIAIRE